MTIQEIEAFAERGDRQCQRSLAFLVLSRDRSTCECGARATETHHVISRRYDGAWSMKNMISLCWKHHQKAHTHEARKRHLNLLRDKYGYEYTEPLWLSALEEAA